MITDGQLLDQIDHGEPHTYIPERLVAEGLIRAKAMPCAGQRGLMFADWALTDKGKKALAAWRRSMGRARR